MSLHRCDATRCDRPDAQDALHRMDTLGVCWSAVSDLLIPEKDLSVVDRDHVATLLMFLTDEYQKASDAFREAIRPGDDP